MVEKAKIVRLVPRQRAVSQETVDRLEELLTAARAGLLVGMVGGFLYDGHHETVIAGEAWTYPTLCRGICRNLDDQLGIIIKIRPPKV